MTPRTHRWMLRSAIGLVALASLGIVALSLAPISQATINRTETPAASPQPAQPPLPKVAGTTKATPQALAAAASRLANGAAPANDGMTLKRVLVIQGPFRHGDYAWDETGVPQGKLIITVDLKAQTLAVFRDGYQIGAAVILYGADDKPTPLGTYHISQKDADHVSNIYDAPMPYMLRLTDDGISIHGAEVDWGNATHGCIGVPVAFAKLLFNQAKIGTPVIVTSGKMMQVPQGAQRDGATLN